MNNQRETINGRLLQFFGEWKVQSGYGTFPLASNLKEKPALESNGAWVSAVVHQGLIEDYHFEEQKL